MVPLRTTVGVHFCFHPRRHILNSRSQSRTSHIKSRVNLKNSSGQMELRLLHLPLTCLPRPLSVPRTLPHPLQIRSQTTHTKGEKPRKQLGFRAETNGTVTLSSSVSPEPSPAPQQHKFWYRSTRSKLPTCSSETS